jgi:hypothetical protein
LRISFVLDGRPTVPPAAPWGWEDLDLWLVPDRGDREATLPVGLPPTRRIRKVSLDSSRSGRPELHCEAQLSTQAPRSLQSDRTRVTAMPPRTAATRPPSRPRGNKMKDTAARGWPCREPGRPRPGRSPAGPMAARRAAVLIRGAAECSRCQPSARKPRRMARPARLLAGIVTRLGVHCYFSPVVVALSLDGRELITATTLAKGKCAWAFFQHRGNY